MPRPPSKGRPSRPRPEWGAQRGHRGRVCPGASRGPGPRPQLAPCCPVTLHAVFLLGSSVAFELPATRDPACPFRFSILCPLLPSVTSCSGGFVLCCCVTNEPEAERLKTTLVSYLGFCFLGSGRQSSVQGPSQAATAIEVPWEPPNGGWTRLKLTQGWVAGCAFLA